MLQDSRQGSYKSAISPIPYAVSDNVVSVAAASEANEPNRARCNWQKIGFAAAAAAQKEQHRLSVDFIQQVSMLSTEILLQILFRQGHLLI